jgi:hypothetical protein
MKYKRLLVIILSLVLISFSCKKESGEETFGTIKDFTGFDGCRMLIVLDSGERLEPVSLPANTTLMANRRVAIKYKNANRVSICMVGPTVDITSLRYL